MAHPSMASATIPVPRTESRQARLNAAIDLFRSEASASGYVVEEVRLRLPVPDVDVMPRVVIAQQNALSGAPPTFPRAKQHRPLSSYPHPPTLSNDHSAVPIRDGSFTGSPARTYIPAKPLSAEQRGAGPTTKAGFKRTVSGSVIFHSVPARTTPSRKDGKSHVPLNSVSKKGPLSSIPYLPTKDGKVGLNTSEQNNGQFWKTVIGGERGKQILQAAESMQRLKHAQVENVRTTDKMEADPNDMEVSRPAKHSSDAAKKSNFKDDVKAKNTDDAKKEEPQENIERENTHHINGHDIPESHVQLLLSSAADISAREHKPLLKEQTSAPGKTSNGESKKSRPQAVVDGKPSGTRATPVSNGRQYSRSRRDGSERRTSSSAARPYKCTKCPSSFDREGHLRVHILAVHEKKRPFVCQVCDASFGHSSSLLRHVRTVHQASPAIGSGKTGGSSRNAPNSNDSNTTKSELVCDDFQDDSEKHFRCSACRMAFNRVALLNRHVADKHPLRSSLSDDESKASA